MKEMILIKNKKEISEVLLQFSDSFFDKTIKNIFNELSQKYAQNAIFKICKENNIMLGMFALYCNNTNEHIAYLSSIVVKKEFQSCGIGTFMLKDILKECNNQKMHFLDLEVSKKNINAISFYNHFGFRQLQVLGKSYILRLPLINHI